MNLLEVHTNPDKLIYSESRYEPHRFPYCIYIPNKETMLKLMRACINVDYKKDLWFFGLNQKNVEDDDDDEE